jgi:hypothetical protein
MAMVALSYYIAMVVVITLNDSHSGIIPVKIIILGALFPLNRLPSGFISGT